MKVLILRGENTTDGTELHHQGEQHIFLFKHFPLFSQPLKHSRHHAAGCPPAASIVAAPFIHTSIRYWYLLCPHSPSVLKSTMQPLMKPHVALIIIATGVSTPTRYNYPISIKPLWDKCD